MFGKQGRLGSSRGYRADQANPSLGLWPIRRSVPCVSLVTTLRQPYIDLACPLCRPRIDFQPLQLQFRSTVPSTSCAIVTPLRNIVPPLTNFGRHYKKNNGPLPQGCRPPPWMDFPNTILARTERPYNPLAWHEPQG